jgi:hypothetical protein
MTTKNTTTKNMTTNNTTTKNTKMHTMAALSSAAATSLVYRVGRMSPPGGPPDRIKDIDDLLKRSPWLAHIVNVVAASRSSSARGANAKL